MGVKKLSWILALLTLGLFAGSVYWVATNETGFWVVVGTILLALAWIMVKSLREMFLTVLLAPKVEETYGLVEGDAAGPGDPGGHRGDPQEAEAAP